MYARKICCPEQLLRPAEWPRPPPWPGADPASPKPAPAPLRRALAAGPCLVRNGRGAALPAPGGPAGGHRTIACEGGGVGSGTGTTNDERAPHGHQACRGREGGSGEGAAAGGHGEAERWTAGEARSAGPRKRGPASCPCPGQRQRGGAAPPRPCAHRPKRRRPARRGGLLPPLRRATRMSPDMRCRSTPGARAQARRARRRGAMDGAGPPAKHGEAGWGRKRVAARQVHSRGGCGTDADPFRADACDAAGALAEELALSGPGHRAGGAGGHERRPREHRPRAGRGRPPASEGRRDRVRGAGDPVCAIALGAPPPGRALPRGGSMPVSRWRWRCRRCRRRRRCHCWRWRS